jgi:hypothetical protein
MVMPGGFHVTIVKDHWQILGKKIKAQIPIGLELTGMGIERSAKQEAAVDTGRYRSSIGHSTNLLTDEGVKKNVQINPADAIWKLTNGIIGIWLYIGTNVEYAPDLERRYGTLLNAMNANKGLLTQALKKALEGSIVI